MATLRIDIDNKKSEKVILAVVKALGLHYQLETDPVPNLPLTKQEKAVYDRLKSSLTEIRQHQDGKIQLQTIDEFLEELS